MKIGIAAPAELSTFRHYFPKDARGNIPNGIGGTIIPTYLADELISRGHTVSIYTLDSTIIEPMHFSSEKLNIFVGKYRHPARQRIFDLFKAESEFVKRAILTDNPDVVSAQWSYEFALGALLTGIPTLITARDAPLWILYYQPSLYRFGRLILAWKVFKQANHVSAVSPYIANHLRKYFFRGNISVIPNGMPLDIDRDHNDHKKETDRNIVYFSISNGWGKRKNETRLLKAFSKVRQSLPSAELWMFGSEHGLGELVERWAKTHSLDEGVRFYGKFDHKALLERLGAEADILVHPSLEESFGNILLEASLCRVPIIGGKSSGAVPYTLGYGKAGLLVNVRSVNELAKGMLVLANDKKTRMKLGEQARQYVLENYSLKKMVDAYEEALKALLN